MSLKEILKSPEAINKHWNEYNLQFGYITLWKFRALINQLVDNEEIGKEFEQPRGIVESKFGQV